MNLAVECLNVSAMMQLSVSRLVTFAPMSNRKRQNLIVVKMPQRRRAVNAPPVLIASAHTVDYCCGSCGTVLMHAEAEQVHNLLIHCTECDSYNATDEAAASVGDLART
jgi:hypothetical protein